MTSQDIHKALQADLYRYGEFAYLKEFRAGTGYSAASVRYLDAWIIQCYPSKPMLATGIEIKVSRGDWLSEKKKPWKRDSAMRITNEFFFACPEGMIQANELPLEVGLIYVNSNARIIVEAPHRECSFTLPFVASLARRVTDKTI